jgi:hypothetical protein
VVLSRNSTLGLLRAQLLPYFDDAPTADDQQNDIVLFRIDKTKKTKKGTRLIFLSLRQNSRTQFLLKSMRSC